MRMARTPSGSLLSKESKFPNMEEVLLCAAYWHTIILLGVRVCTRIAKKRIFSINMTEIISGDAFSVLLAQISTTHRL